MEPFEGRDVTISADADEPGRKFANAVAAALKPMAAAVRLSLPPGDDGRDVADFADWADARAWVKKHVQGERPLFQPLALITPSTWQWIMPGWIPRAELVLLGGPPESGKGLVSTCLMACLSNGRLPDGTALERPQTILMIQDEDSWRKTVVPRLLRHRADMGRIFRLDSDEDGTPQQILTKYADKLPPVDMLYVDPLTGPIGATSGAEVVRPYLEAWVSLARRLDATVLGVVHTAKFAKQRLLQGNVADLIAGSQQWVAVARFALGLFPEPDTQDRLLLRVKSNADSVDKSTGFRIQAELVDGERTIRTPFVIEHDVLDAARMAINEKPVNDIREALIGHIEGFQSGQLYRASDIIGEVMEETDKSKSAVRKQITRLAKENRIVVHSEGHGVPVNWSLPHGYAP